MLLVTMVAAVVYDGEGSSHEDHNGICEMVMMMVVAVVIMVIVVVVLMVMVVVLVIKAVIHMSCYIHAS